MPLCVKAWIWATSGCLFLHKCTWDGNGCQREYVLVTSVTLNPEYHYVERTWRMSRQHHGGWSPTRQSLWVQELQTCVSLHETHFECLLGSTCLTSIILPCSTVCVCVCVRVCVCVCVQERQKETEEGTSTREHKSIWSLNNSTFLLSNMYLISLSGWQRIFETNPS
jgi:hypothetical protein